MAEYLLFHFPNNLCDKTTFCSEKQTFFFQYFVQFYYENETVYDFTSANCHFMSMLLLYFINKILSFCFYLFTLISVNNVLF